jgi:glycosyltransferase involved in cell wall biosynthesis
MPGGGQDSGGGISIRVKKAMNKDKVNVCIINSPICGSGEKRDLDNHIRTLEPLCHEIFVVAGELPNKYADNVHITELETGKSWNPSILVRIARYFISQLKLTYHLVRLSRNFDIVLLDIGQYRNILPTLVSKLLGKETAIVHRGSNNILEMKLATSGWRKVIFIPFQFSLYKLCYFLVDHIICDSLSIITTGNMEGYRRKMLSDGGNFIERVSAQTGPSPSQRENIVGYFGRLGRIKGIINFVRAMPLILEKRNDISFLIAGEGDQRVKIEKEIRDLGLGDHVTLGTWVPDEEIAQYLARMKLFVLPSYEEGMPNILREVMASHTIVLSTPVGAIPDLVKDEETGFIMEDNSPECIARNILRVLENPDLDKIAQNARALIERESSFEAVMESWKDVLENIRLKAK